MPGHRLFLRIHAAVNMLFWVFSFYWPSAILGTLVSTWLFAFLVFIGSYDQPKETSLLEKAFLGGAILIIPILQILPVIAIEWVSLAKIFRLPLYFFGFTIIIGCILGYLNGGFSIYRWRDVAAAIVGLYVLSLILVTRFNESFDQRLISAYETDIREKRVEKNKSISYAILVKPGADEPIRKMRIPLELFERLSIGSSVMICRYSGALNLDSYWICPTK